MNNNELYTHKRSDTIKWIIAFTLIVVLLAGMISVWVVLWKDKPVDENPVQEQEQEAVVTDGDGNVMESGKVYAMPAHMVFAATAAEDTNASEGIMLKATIKPEADDNKAVVWDVSFVNPSSGWATGKKAEDYVSVTPMSNDETTANVQCIKAFGEQIKIMVTSELNEYAKAECILDYARRITDVALWSYDPLDDYICGFGENEILVDLVLTSYQEIRDGYDGMWAGGYGPLVVMDNVSITPEDEADPEQKWADESAERTFRFSDYTIKDNLPFVAGEQESNEYYAPLDFEVDVNDEFIDVMYDLAFLFSDGKPLLNVEIWGADSEGFAVGNTPYAIIMNAQDETGFGQGASLFTEERYNDFIVEFVQWLQDNPDTPIATFTYTFTGKYSSFSKTFTFRYNPESIVTPVFSIDMNQTTGVM